jgi:hypothetical protein
MKRLSWILAGVVVLAVAGLITWRAVAPSLAAEPAIHDIATPPGAIVKQDRENYYSGPYIAYAGDWSVDTGKVALRRGDDYRDHIFIRPATFPAGTDIHWQWPQKEAASGVYGYMHLAYGFYAGGVPKEPVEAKQVSRIAELKTDFKVTTSKTSGDFNVLQETFLTSKRADSKTRVLEVGFLTGVSNSGRKFFEGSRHLGTWTDPDGRTWDVAINRKYCMFVPVLGDFSSGVLHYDAAFRWLVTMGELSGDAWFNGLAIGAEPVAGSGSMRVERWNIVYR